MKKMADLIYFKTLYICQGVATLPDSRLVVRTLIGERALTLRASLITKWLRLAPVARGLVRFFGFPMFLGVSSFETD